MSGDHSAILQHQQSRLETHHSSDNNQQQKQKQQHQNDHLENGGSINSSTFATALSKLTLNFQNDMLAEYSHACHLAEKHFQENAHAQIKRLETKLTELEEEVKLRKETIHKSNSELEKKEAIVDKMVVFLGTRVNTYLMEMGFQ